MFALMLFAAAALAVPHPDTLRTFRDWTVGCDNERACQAVALMADRTFEGATLAVERGPEADAVPILWVTIRSEGAESPEWLAIDGRRFALTLERATESLRVRDAAEAARMLGQATRIEALDRTGKRLASVLTGGSAAALLHMDERQRRVGTVGALVRRGPGRVVPAPPALPVVRVPAASTRPPSRLSAALTRAARGDSACSKDDAQKDPLPETYRLDATHSLAVVAIPCGSGAYNFLSALLVGDNAGRFRPANFDAPSAVEQGGKNLAYNVDWDVKTRRLSTFFKGRGIGDCGAANVHAWDGARFRLVEQSVMGECRGSTDYITTWRAQVVQRR